MTDVTIGDVIAAFRRAIHAADIHSSSGFGSAFDERVSLGRVAASESRAETMLNRYIDQRITTHKETQT